MLTIEQYQKFHGKDSLSISDNFLQELFEQSDKIEKLREPYMLAVDEMSVILREIPIETLEQIEEAKEASRFVCDCVAKVFFFHRLVLKEKELKGE